MTIAYDMWLFRNAFREVYEWGGKLLASSQAGSGLSPIFRGDAEGAAKFRLSGDFNGSGSKDISILFYDVGTPDDQIAGVTPLATTARAPESNVGNGTCETITPAATCVKAFDVALTCKRATGTQRANATATGEDYAQSQAAGQNPIVGLRMINNMTGEEYDAGNGGTIQFALQSGGDPHVPVYDTTHGITLSSNFTVDSTTLFLSANPITAGMFSSSSDIIHVKFADNNLYVLAAPESVSGQWQCRCWPPCKAQVASSTAIPVITSGGFKIILTDTASSVTTYYGTDSDGDILTVGDLESILGRGGMAGAGGVASDGSTPVAETGYRIHGDCVSHELIPLQVETLTYAGGVDTDSLLFEALVTGGGTSPGLGYVLPDGTAKTLYSGTDFEFALTITEGTEPFATGDQFLIAFRQAQVKLSLDGGTTYGSAIDLESSEVTLGSGIKLVTVMPKQGAEPFVLNDTLAARAQYRNSINLMAYPSRQKRWRSKRCDYRQAILCDSMGQNFDGTMAVFMDHNISSGATIDIFCVGDGNIHKFYGSVTARDTTTISTGKTLASDEHKNGYISMISGTCQGKTYAITGNTTGGVYTVTGNPQSDGVAVGDEYLIIPLSSFSDVQYHKQITSVNATIHGEAMADNIYSGSWIVSVNDPLNDSGYIEVSSIHIGAVVKPKLAVGNNYEPHTYLRKEFGAFSTEIEPYFEDKRFPRGLSQKIFTVEYRQCEAATIKARLETMLSYVKNKTRVIPALFWESNESPHVIIMTWIGGGATVDTSAVDADIDVYCASIEAE